MADIHNFNTPTTPDHGFERDPANRMVIHDGVVKKLFLAEIVFDVVNTPPSQLVTEMAHFKQRVRALPTKDSVLYPIVVIKTGSLFALPNVPFTTLKDIQRLMGAQLIVTNSGWVRSLGTALGGMSGGERHFVSSIEIAEERREQLINSRLGLNEG
jgi:hypothetical protein